MRCRQEHGIHHFSQDNNMNPGKQLPILSILTQVEEMLIAQVNPILHVTHVFGGKYKYNGHTISFPQYINLMSKNIPRWIEDLDILIVRREGYQYKNYDFIVCRSCMMNVLHYKIQMDKYC